jgi:hypothetical protein
MNDIPQVSVGAIEALVRSAYNKIDVFDRKIEGLKRQMALMESDRNGLELIVEHIELSDKRRELLSGLVVYPHEYGNAEFTSEDIYKDLKDRLQSAKSRINRYEIQLKKRNDGIEFIKKDISRLEKIKKINFQSKWIYWTTIDI